jgi:hypothetical protein
LEQLKKVVSYDPFTDTGATLDKNSPEAKVIFARQECEIRFGVALGLKGDFYLYINAEAGFFKGAEERFAKEFKTVKRADAADEKKVIVSVGEDKTRAATGFGSIFG